ncbi:peptidoglycan bridge formation glycyltransferase FemA/FemB family protein [Spirochaeta cellobiosiphila]|uniref:peptidoglycan bridge formation glycyltransferase FemA/FemB family protein n=1 Tax=Spirochaeta cellobiosiphila TaxID=504483 RepID=UPI000421F4EA|nr:peptidoglycan bridge formation glycyltransferase FemA/FemB family protein [Spirochaeta cellobiosiphila]
MIKITRKRRFVIFSEIYFSLTYPIMIHDKFDVAKVTYSSVKPKGKFKVQNTSFIDLDVEIEDIYSKYNRGLKSSIKKAKKIGFDFTDILEPTNDDIKIFNNFYNQFANSKNLGKCDKSLLLMLAKKNLLHINWVNLNNDKLVCHANILDNGRCRLLYSASLFRNIDDEDMIKNIGFANKLLHHHEFELYKKLNFDVYDFGGIDLTEQDKQKAGIAKFKKAFNGRIIEEYSYIICKSLKGRIYLLLRKLYGK